MGVPPPCGPRNPGPGRVRLRSCASAETLEAGEGRRGGFGFFVLRTPRDAAPGPSLDGGRPEFEESCLAGSAIVVQQPVEGFDGCRDHYDLFAHPSEQPAPAWCP